jgi:DNA-binding NarL/FixJ family response regulator
VPDPDSSAAVRVLVVEDDPETREYLAEALRADEDYSVVSAGTLAGGAERLDQEPPDLMLVDLGLPDGSGLDLIRLARGGSSDVLILVISAFDDEQSLIGALQAGASGYLLKSEEPADIRLAVRQVRDGGAPISPGVASHLLKHFETMKAMGKTSPGARPTAQLTSRERSVLELVVRGCSNQEAADKLGISRHTVATHVKNIYRKLEVNSRGEAAFEALRLGLVQIDGDGTVNS